MSERAARANVADTPVRTLKVMIGIFRSFLVPVVLLAVSPFVALAQQEVRIGVLGLFHPSELVLEQDDGQVLSIAADGAARGTAIVLNGEPGHRQVIFRAENDRVSVDARIAGSWTAVARDGGAVHFRITVPGRFHRDYWGRLTIIARNGELVAVVAMDRETAVASIVAAEMDEHTPLEALKAQAVVTRSFLAAGPRHRDFDFCDTTHCQFIKSPPLTASRVVRAIRATRGLVLEYRDKPLAAMYFSRCGGQTRSLRDAGMDPGENYPYYAVPCAWCRQHSFTWHGRVGDSAQAPRSGDERERNTEARQWGWSTIPGSDFTATKDNWGWQLEGHSVGHGVGMCQHGAAGMAASGASFREILAHYYPNTSLTVLP